MKLRKYLCWVISAILLLPGVFLIFLVVLGEGAEELFWWVREQLDRLDPS